MAKRAESQPRRFLQESAPGVSPRTQRVYFHSHWSHLLEKTGYKYFWPFAATFLLFIVAPGAENLYEVAAWLALVFAYALPAGYWGWKEKNALKHTGMFDRLTLVQLSLYLQKPDTGRKRVVERLASDEYVDSREVAKNPRLYIGEALLAVQRAARAIWFATDGYCPSCEARRECRPVLPQEPVLPPKVEAECFKCGATAYVPRKVVGVVGCPEHPFEFRDNVLYVRLWDGVQSVETGSLDAVEIRPGGDFSYDHAVVAVMQRLENNGLDFCRGEVVGHGYDGDATYLWGRLPVYVHEDAPVSENVRRMLSTASASSLRSPVPAVLSERERDATFELLR